MAAILADDNFNFIFLNENDRNPIWISLKFVPRRAINDKSVIFPGLNVLKADSSHFLNSLLVYSVQQLQRLYIFVVLPSVY